MISIKKATVKDYNTIVQIGNISVGEAHKGGFNRRYGCLPG